MQRMKIEFAWHYFEWNWLLDLIDDKPKLPERFQIVLVDFNFCLELQLRGSLASDEWLWVFVIGFVVYVLLCIVHRC